MRLVASAAITIFLLAGTYFYTSFADSVRRDPVELVAQIDDAKWQVEIQRTFRCVPDSDYDTASLVLQFQGSDVLRRDDELAPSEEIKIDLPGEVEQGRNDIYVEANLATSEDFDFSSSDARYAMRVIVRRGYQVIADRSFWLGEGNTSFKESVPFEAPAVQKTDSHTHGNHDAHPPTSNQDRAS